MLWKPNFDNLKKMVLEFNITEYKIVPYSSTHDCCDFDIILAGITINISTCRSSPLILFKLKLLLEILKPSSIVNDYNLPPVVFILSRVRWNFLIPACFLIHCCIYVPYNDTIYIQSVQCIHFISSQYMLTKNTKCAPQNCSVLLGSFQGQRLRMYVYIFPTKHMHVSLWHTVSHGIHFMFTFFLQNMCYVITHSSW